MRFRSAGMLVLAVLLAGCAGGNAVTTTVTTVAPTTSVAPTTTNGASTTTPTTVSDPGLGWVKVSSDEAVFGGPGNQMINSVVAGGPGLVAVGYDGSDAAVWVSIDGYTWTRIEDVGVFGGPGDQGANSVVAGGPGLVAVGYDGSDAAVWVSIDGYTWTRIEDVGVFGGPDDQWINSVAAGGPGLVAVGSDYKLIGFNSESKAAVWVSANGYTWTRIPDDEALVGRGSVLGINSVAAGGPGLVAVGSHGGGGHVVLACSGPSAVVWISADGYAWTRIEDGAVFGGPGAWEINSVVVGGPGLVAAGYASTDEDACDQQSAAVWVSADGYTWTRIEDGAVFGGPGTHSGINSVAVVEAGLVAVGYDTSGGNINAAVWLSGPFQEQ